MATPILVTGAAGRVGAVGRTVTELLLKQSKAALSAARARPEGQTSDIYFSPIEFDSMFER